MSMPSEAASEPQQFAGRLSDGRAPLATPVTVQLADTGVAILLPGEASPRLWPYADLRSSVPLRRDARDVLLSAMPDRAETLFIADPRFAFRLLARAPGLSAASHRWRNLRPGLAAVAIVACITAGIWTTGFEPAKAVARHLPQPTREALGRSVLASMSNNGKPCETPAARLALDRLTKRLGDVATSPAMTVRVELLDWSLVNAFATPGGHIILTRGLVQQAGSPDEVAGVLAHEIGHAIELHPEAGILRGLSLAAAAQLVFVGTSGPLTNLGVILTQLRYTRVAEREADAHALRILQAAGISAKGFGDFFERLEGKRPATGSATRFTEIEVIRTHPLSAERLALIRAQPNYPATAALSADDWNALRKGCDRAPQPESAHDQIARPDLARPAPGKDAEADREIAAASRTLETSPDDVAALSRRARAYTQRNRHAEALVDYARASQLKPQDAVLHYGRGLALYNLRRHEEALAAYDAALQLQADYANARNGHGNANRALKRYDAALQDFDDLIKAHPEFVHARYNRGLTYRDLDRTEDAIRDFEATLARDKDYTAAYTSRGMAYEKTGERDKAIADFRAALAAPDRYNNGGWAHRTARERLKALGVSDP